MSLGATGQISLADLVGSIGMLRSLPLDLEPNRMPVPLSSGSLSLGDSLELSSPSSCEIDSLHLEVFEVESSSKESLVFLSLEGAFSSSTSQIMLICVSVIFYTSSCIVL